MFSLDGSMTIQQSSQSVVKLRNKLIKVIPRVMGLKATGSIARSFLNETEETNEGGLATFSELITER